MKNFLLFTFAFLTYTAVAAQSPLKLSPQAEKYCTELTRSMVNELRLNELEYIKLKELNRERLLATQEILKNHGSDTHLVEQRLEELAQNYEAKLMAFLNANQLQAYANFKNQPNQEVRFVALTGNE